MSEANKFVELAGMPLGRSCHACAFHPTRDEEYRVLLPSMKERHEQDNKGFEC